MTRTARQPLRLEVDAPAGRTAELVWDLSTRAGRTLAAAGDRRTEPFGAVALVLRQTRADQAIVHAEGITRSGERVTLRQPRRCAASWSRDEDLEHIDAEGVVHCTLRHSGGTRALFAHSPLLAILGISPGAYTLRAASIVTPE